MKQQEEDRFDRQVKFLGKAGQDSMEAARVVVVGIGGLGTHVVQQLALLVVRQLFLIDAEQLAFSNLNRYIGARHDDPIPGSLKVDLGERLARSINPELEIKKVPDSLVSVEGFEAIKKADYIFGCLDNEGARLILNEIAAAYSKRYI